MEITMMQPLTRVKGSQRANGLRKANLDHHADGRRVNHFLPIPPILLRAAFPFSGAPLCDRLPRFSPAACFSRAPPRGPIVVSSSLPIRRTAMASTSAWPRAKNAARMPHNPTVIRAISRKPRPTDGSIRTKSPARCRRLPRIAVIRLAANTSPSPASARPPTVRFRRQKRAHSLIRHSSCGRRAARMSVASEHRQAEDSSTVFDRSEIAAKCRRTVEPPHSCRGNGVTPP